MKHIILAVLAMAPAAQAAQQDSGQAQSQASPRELTAYLPAETPLVVDLYDGAACVEALMNLVEPLPKELPKQVAAVVQALPLLVKSKTGMTLEDLLTVLAPGQVTAALFPDAKKPFPVVMSRVEDPAEIWRVVKRLKMKLPIHIKDKILTMSSSRRNLEVALRFRSGGEPSLLGNRRYVEGRIELKPRNSVRVYVNMEYLRRIRSRGFFQALPGPVRLLAGPMAQVLDTASRVDGRLDILPDRLALSGCLDATATAGPRQGPPVASLLGHGADERRLPAAPLGTLAALSLDRDPRGFFKNADRLLDEDTASKTKQFLSVANQFLGGLDFTDGLLPALDLPGAIFVTDTAPESEEAQPRIKLPALTLAVRLTGHEKRATKRALTRAMQTIGFVATNERRQSKRNPVQLRARNEKRGEYRLQYLAYGDWEGEGQPPTDLNFGVTLLFAHEHLILSSTRDGAVRAAQAIKISKGKAVRGDYLLVTGAGLAQYAQKNQEVLSLDRVLKEGGTLRQADQFWHAAAAVLRILEAEVNVAPGQGDTSFRVSLRRVSE